MRRRRREARNISKGIVTGIVGGLVASWMMDQFQAVESRVQQAWQKSAHREQKPDSAYSEPDSDNATMKVADRLANLVANRHLTKEQKKKAGPIVHYAYGALIGGLYGGISEVFPLARLGAGTGYATAAWLFGDEIAVPKLGLSKPPEEFPLSVHANALASHLVYGVTTHAVHKGLRAVI
ncbi:MAG TPA: DUF1440 domain-containing protein [Terriglobales bacterium]|nr:DUF1440 domain-containing protein [Terriglobales bacterium]